MAGGVSPATAAAIILPLFLHASCSFIFPLLSFNNVAAATAAASPPAPFSFSFNFSNPSNYNINDLRFEGDAAMNGDLVDLTRCNSNDCKGRMSYNHPVPLYDNSTGEVASFATTFTFVVINGVDKEKRDGGGMTFFLSSYPSTLPPGSSGSFLGLINNGGTTTASGADRFVAVEFDTYADPWDPSSDHIGIDINSVKSVNTTRLPSYSLSDTMTASITFDGSTRMLEASLHFDHNHSLGVAQVKWQLPEPLSDLLPSEVAVGFSAATGPKNGELHQILSWSFNSTVVKASKGPNNNIQPKQAQAFGSKGQSMDTRVIIAGNILSVPVVWFILSWFISKCAGIFFVRRAGLSEFRRFEYQDLVEATSNFSRENLLGAGSFGVVHKGILKKHLDGTTQEPEELAVKRIKESTLGVANTFLHELQATRGMSHENLVNLKGWCFSGIKWRLSDFLFCREQKQSIDLFLVYELVPNGSLYDHLFNPRHAVLPWATRYKIAQGIASGLHYLHHECNPYILHRDIKPGNILLDADFSPKLADFGLSRIANDNNLVPSTMAVGTTGYMDPLCMRNGKVKFGRSSDVYSFGIVLLDIACTGKTADQLREMYRSQNSLEKFIEDAAHVKLRGAFDRSQVKQVAVLGLWCCFPNDVMRPSMQDVIRVLDNDDMALLRKGMEILKNDASLVMMGIVEDDRIKGDGIVEDDRIKGDGDDQPLMRMSATFIPDRIKGGDDDQPLMRMSTTFIPDRIRGTSIRRSSFN